MMFTVCIERHTHNVRNVRKLPVFTCVCDVCLRIYVFAPKWLCPAYKRPTQRQRTFGVVSSLLHANTYCNVKQPNIRMAQTSWNNFVCHVKEQLWKVVSDSWNRLRFPPPAAVTISVLCMYECLTCWSLRLYVCCATGNWVDRWCFASIVP